MSIWIYRDVCPKPTESIIWADFCLFCQLHMRYIGQGVKVCLNCGWWNIRWVEQDVYNGSYGTYSAQELKGTCAYLKNLDLTDINDPLDEVRNYLLMKYESRLTMNPRLYELTVESVFQSLGYHTRVTAYTRDGGIDVILDGPNSTLIGVQVKRYKNQIGVEQIRTFTGTLFLRGFTKGVFVTTSGFSTDARREASEAALKGISIELMDGQRFLEALNITRGKVYISFEKWHETVGQVELWNYGVKGWHYNSDT